MMKTKFFRRDSSYELEKEVNVFIQGKKVVNISYSVASCGYSYIHCCCVLYQSW